MRNPKSVAVFVVKEIAVCGMFIPVADDCFRLGSVAYFNQDYYHTVMWITEALNIWNTEQPKTIDKPTLLDYLSYSLYMVSNCFNVTFNVTNHTFERNKVQS